MICECGLHAMVCGCPYEEPEQTVEVTRRPLECPDGYTLAMWERLDRDKQKMILQYRQEQLPSLWEILNR